jgi:hypothetical protein
MHTYDLNRPVQREWRCRGCRALLGIACAGRLHVKYRDLELRIGGVCEHLCRRCRTVNTTTVGGEATRFGLPESVVPNREEA